MPQPDRNSRDTENLARLFGRLWSAALDAHSAAWDYAAAQLELHRPPPPPTHFAFTISQETTPMGIKFRAKAPLSLPDVPEAADIATQVITLSVDGGEVVETVLGRDATEYDAGLFDAGQVLDATLTYRDAAGNPSQNPLSTNLTITDTVAPPDPGTFGFSLTQEFVPDEPPVEEPPVEEPPVE